MAGQVYIWIAISILSFSPFSSLATETADKEATPRFAFSWLDDKDTFQAGDIASVKIKVLENFDKIDKNKFKPTLTVNGKTGNSSFISGLVSNFGEDLNDWRISFAPIMVGLFNVVIDEDHTGVFDSSLHFQVVPGRIYPSVSVAIWKGLITEFQAGTKASVLILPKDAFGNNVTSKEEPNVSTFTLSIFHTNNSISSQPNITYTGWNEFGYIVIEFTVKISGSFLLHIQGGNQTLKDTPLPFKVNPGLLEVSNCVIKWDFEPKAWQLFSKMEIFLHQRDQFDNLVPGLYAFDAEIVEKDTNLSIPVSDLHFEEVQVGIQLFSFSNLEPGNFLLTISDSKHSEKISNMSYSYTVYIGYCDGSKSVVNGTDFNNSIAGEMEAFSVYLYDVYQYPSPVKVEWLQVLIVRENDSYYVWPTVNPMQILNGTGPVGAPEYQAGSKDNIFNALSGNPSDKSVMESKLLASAFDVIYTPDKTGFYKVYVFCGNILLNSGHSFKKEVLAGEVNLTLSEVMEFSPKVAKLTKNEIVVSLMDSFGNPVPSKQSSLKLEIASNHSSNWNVVNNSDSSSYTVLYTANDVGTYEMCASLDGKNIPPCPFTVNVYSGEYFPKASDDTVSVWEDESIAFDALANDFFAGHNASIMSFTNPLHGSVMQNGRLFRYTPFRDYYGNDSFMYTISDINANLATASVNISVLSIPPQFVAFPSELQATEDVLSPRYGGFSGFEIRYSDLAENISVNLSAESGSIFLSPRPMQFEQPMWNVNRGEGEAKGLVLEGCLEVINFALQSIQYLGNGNFCGGDTIRVLTKNANGINSLDVPISVEPINDPPYIVVPEIIILNSDKDESLIFDREMDNFNFSIGDPDILSFPGGESNFMVSFSVEVDEGYLITSLPSELIDTTELKLKNSYRWQPLQTYVTISKHFTVKASGVRFQGTISHCNRIMQELLYNGGEYGGVMTVTVNDMGNHGCYPDCSEMNSVPLYAEATVNLIRRRPMSSFLAHGLGTAIALEFVLVVSMGMLTVFFMCKCAILLLNERRINGGEIKNNERSGLQSCSKRSKAVGFFGAKPSLSSPVLEGGGNENGDALALSSL